MIRIRRKVLPGTILDALAGYQKLVDSEPDYGPRVAEAKTLFKRRNTTRDRVFVAVRASLVEMCHGARRCMYCEDAPADEVEHFAPKDLYPEHAFSWPNYLYSCGICNGPKNNKWGLFLKGSSSVVEVFRPQGAAVVPQPSGVPALIDPSLVDPLRFLIMDLKGTFQIVPLHPPGTPAHSRAEYTIDILKMKRQRSRQTVLDSYFRAVPAALRW